MFALIPAGVSLEVMVDFPLIKPQLWFLCSRLESDHVTWPQPWRNQRAESLIISYHTGQREPCRLVIHNPLLIYSLMPLPHEFSINCNGKYFHIKYQCGEKWDCIDFEQGVCQAALSSSEITVCSRVCVFFMLRCCLRHFILTIQFKLLRILDNIWCFNPNIIIKYNK